MKTHNETWQNSVKKVHWDHHNIHKLLHFYSIQKQKVEIIFVVHSLEEMLFYNSQDKMNLDKRGISHTDGEKVNCIYSGEQAAPSNLVKAACIQAAPLLCTR